MILCLHVILEVQKYLNTKIQQRVLTCAECGLIEISKAVPELEKELYLKSAIKILKATEECYCSWTNGEDSIVKMGTEAYHFGAKNIPIVYGDYYFI